MQNGFAARLARSSVIQPRPPAPVLVRRGFANPGTSAAVVRAEQLDDFVLGWEFDASVSALRLRLRMINLVRWSLEQVERKGPPDAASLAVHRRGSHDDALRP